VGGWGCRANLPQFFSSAWLLLLLLLVFWWRGLLACGNDLTAQLLQQRHLLISRHGSAGAVTRMKH
jgi:hypothetical protein